ncbi:hypothetical protein [Nevskia ramosa]|uniref:hypothetical protein n=1 Tax=Nevskia ramosa TaxID=64002 RepID=UPI0012EC06CC|nr:hypothetical protein [Nevskia ramosa]
MTSQSVQHTFSQKHPKTGALIYVFKKLWRLIRWVFEFAIPVYVLIFVICISLLSFSMGRPSFLGQYFDAAAVGSTGKVPVEQVSVKAAVAAATSKAEIQLLNERVTLLKENQERTLTIIGAIAALLTFLGFKGYTTISEAHTKVSDAESRAEDVQALVNQFFEHDYNSNSIAALNVMHGIVAREIANTVAKMLKLKDPQSDPCTDAEYVRVLDDGINYVNLALKDASKVNPSVIKRAHGVRGNLYKRKKDFREALKSVHTIIAASGEDENAWFNVACYSAQIAGSLPAGPASDAERKVLSSDALGALRKSFKLNPSMKQSAIQDEDLAWLKANYAVEFADVTS